MSVPKAIWIVAYECRAMCTI